MGQGCTVNLGELLFLDRMHNIILYLWGVCRYLWRYDMAASPLPCLSLNYIGIGILWSNLRAFSNQQEGHGRFPLFLLHTHSCIRGFIFSQSTEYNINRSHEYAQRRKDESVVVEVSLSSFPYSTASLFDVTSFGC